MKRHVISLSLFIFSSYPIFSQCNYSIDLIDSWGDGWQGGQVEVMVAGLSVGTFTLATGTGPETYYFLVNNGEEIRCTYSAGSFPQENEYHIFDADGNEIFADGVGNNIPSANNTLAGAGSCPSCPSPVMVSVDSITVNSANLSWYVGTVTEWEIEYDTAGFIQGTGTLISPVNIMPYQLTGLNPFTSYDFYIRAICNVGDTSIWKGPNSFTTECIAVTAPYFENFENSGLIPMCWSSTSTTGEVWNFNHPGGNFHGASNDHTTGSGYFAWADDSENPASTDITLLSPHVDISGLTAPALYFWRFSDNEGSGVNATLYVDVWDGSVWHNQFATLSGNTNSWHQEIVDLSSLIITGPIQIRFLVDEANSSYFDDICVDDIEIINFITCPQPTLLNLISYTDSSVEIGWTESGSATLWNIQYGPAGFTLGSGSLINDVTDNPHTVNGLVSLTPYDFYVQAKCSSSDSSSWLGPLTIMTSSLNPTPCESGISVPDGGCVDIPISVSGLNNILGDNVLLNGIYYIMQHTYDGDIIITLESPTGISCTLSQQNGGGNNNYGIIDGTCTQYTNFTMSATTPIANGTPPFVGNFIPDNDLSVFDNINPNGTWIIRICDVWNVDTGTFEFAYLDFQNVLPPVVMKINEIDVTQDIDTAEFVELYDGGVGNFPLDNFSLIFYDGAGDTVLSAIDLNGYMTDTNGYFVVGDTGVSNVQIVLQDSIQDGCDAVVLYNDMASNHPVGSGISINNIQDAVVYHTDDLFDLQLLALLNTGQPEINENIAGESSIQSLSRLPNGVGGTRNTQNYYVSIPTPGDSNLAIPSIVWSDSTFTENTILNNGSIENSISILLINDRFSHTGLLTEGIDFYSLFIPNGLTTQINVVSDTIAEISMTGNAIAHMDSNDVHNATIAFKNNVFVYGDTVYNKFFKNDSSFINFFDFATPQMTWDTTIFYEDSINHGGIANTIHLHLENTYFPIDSGILNDTLFYITANVPQGLNVVISLIDSVNAIVSLTGNAAYNNDSNDVNNLTIVFLDSTFTGYYANEVINSTYDSLKIDFNDGLSDSTEILTFYFPLEIGAATIDHQNKTVAIEVNQYADLSYLIPTFTLSTGATATISGIPQISVITPNDYSNPVVYNVLAQDSITNTNWVVSVTQEMSINTNETNKLKIYPNPANNFLIIECNDVALQFFTLLNTKQQIVFDKQISSVKNYYTIPLNSIPEGVYILKINVNSKILYKKIIILK